jgi:AcrR family transcriptional regulator
LLYVDSANLLLSGVMLSMPTSRLRPYHHGDLREALLVAGRQLLAKKGAGGLSLRETARMAGVSHNAPYKHFPTREALLAGLAVQGFNELAARTAEASARSRKEPAVARATAYIEFALENQALFRLMFSGDINRTEFPEVREAAATGLAALGGFVEENYGWEKADEATISAWAFVHGLAQLILDDQIPQALAGNSKKKLAKRVIAAMNAALSGRA